jgi:hypothetical protein
MRCFLALEFNCTAWMKHCNNMFKLLSIALYAANDTANIKKWRHVQVNNKSEYNR